MSGEIVVTDKNSTSDPVFSLAIALIAWLVPGLGHLFLRRWGRAIAFFVAVGGLAMVGHAMRGQLFGPGSHDPFGTLGFLADAAAGVFYLLPQMLMTVAPDISHATGDYGTRFIAAAGIVNLLAVLDAFGTARGGRG